MNEIPTWLQNVISSAGGAVIMWLLSHRSRRSIDTNTDATALQTMTKVAADLARQVQAFTDEIPMWKQKIAVETARANHAEQRNTNADLIYQEAKIIVENLPHLYYAKDPDEPESPIEKRFKAIKAAAAKIVGCMEKTEAL